MEKIKLVFRDLYINRKLFSSIVFEKMLIVFLCYIMISDSVGIVKSIQSIHGLDKANVYVNCDSTTDEKISKMSEDENVIEKSKELNTYIEQNFNNYSYWEYICDDKYNGKNFYQANTNLYFFDLYNIRVMQGRNFKKSDENIKDGVKPVIVGYGLRNKYKIGKQYVDIDYTTGREYRFKVIGVLRKGAYYPSLTILGGKYYLDNRFIRLIDDNMLNSFANVDMMLGSKVIFSKSEKDVREIEKRAQDEKLFDMNFNKLDNTVTYYLNRFLKGMTLMLLVVVTIIIILLITGINRLAMFIEKNSSNFAVKMVCGAEKQSIKNLLKIYLLCLDIIAIIPLIVYIVFTSSNFIWLFIIIIFEVLLNGIIITFTLKRISVENINDLVRRE